MPEHLFFGFRSNVTQFISVEINTNSDEESSSAEDVVSENTILTIIAVSCAILAVLWLGIGCYIRHHCRRRA
jgi:hypothetical protein